MGVESGLLMFPINILIITIFRSIRPRIVSKSQNDNFETLRSPAVNIPTILKVCFAWSYCTSMGMRVCFVYYFDKLPIITYLVVLAQKHVLHSVYFSVTLSSLYAFGLH